MANINEKNESGKCNLDKLAQLYPNQSDLTIDKLRKRAKAKYFTVAYTKKLASLRSFLQKSYNNTIYGCANNLKQSGKKLVSTYCNNRWCVVCNRIRTAKLINEYYPVLRELPDKYFVTLTVPNVISNVLRSTIVDMIRKIQNIRRLLYKQGVKIIGVRKLECTYNAKQDTYHPHIHLIVSGYDVATKIVHEWLRVYPEASNIAQDVRPADDGSIMELFKYFSKIISSNNTVYVRALDNIFCAMYGLRTYQSIGIRKVVSEDIDSLISETITALEASERRWTWHDCDWVDEETGELLTWYSPDSQMINLINRITM